ncbi:hypothetical protein F2S72_01815 [Pseudomonas syringae pv. actinidiae]|nr:hypothetical protein [Pseudomonas syringae pv. actinidiae]
MSDAKSTLNSVTARIKAGLGKINSEAKLKAEGKATAPQHDEVEMDHEFDQRPHPGAGERLSAHEPDHGDIDDGFIIDAEPEPAKPKKKGLDIKQKVLLVFGVVAVGLWFTKQQDNAPVHVPSATEEQHLDGFKKTDAAAAEVPGPTFNLEESAPHTAEPGSVAASSGNDDALGFGKPGAKDAANGPIGADVLTADMNEEFAKPAEESNEVLDPFTGEVNTVPNHPADLPVSEKHDAGPAPVSAAGVAKTAPVSGDVAMNGARLTVSLT